MLPYNKNSKEKDSDELTEKSSLALLRNPYIAADQTNWVVAHEDENGY